MPGYKAFVKGSMQRGQLVTIHKGMAKYTGVVEENSFLQSDHGRVEVDAVVKLRDDKNNCDWIIPFGSAMDIVIKVLHPVEEKLAEHPEQDVDEEYEPEDVRAILEHQSDEDEGEIDDKKVVELRGTFGVQDEGKGITSEEYHKKPKPEQPTAAELRQRRKSNVQEGAEPRPDDPKPKTALAEHKKTKTKKGTTQKL